MKRCSCCKQTKPKRNFHKNKSNKDGLSYSCKRCAIKAVMRYRKTERGKLVVKEANKRYRKTDKGKAMRHRQWLKRKGSLAAHIHQVVSNIKSRCEILWAWDYKYYGGRGIRCCFSRLDLAVWLRENNIEPRGKQIHRIDNDGDYTLDNIEFLTRKEHLRKHLIQRKEEHEKEI